MRYYGHFEEKKSAKPKKKIGRIIFLIVLILVLLGVSLLIISNTVKLAVYDRRNEISIMIFC